MSSQNQERYRSHNSSIIANCDALEQDVRQSREASEKVLAAAVQPILSLPEAMDTVAQRGAPGEMEKLTSLARTIAADNDVFIAKKKDIDQEFDKVIADRPAKKKKLADHYSRVHQVGIKYIELNDQMQHTLVVSTDQFVDIVSGNNQSSQPEAQQ